MRVIAIVVFVVQALVFQGSNASCLRSACGNVLAAPAVSTCGCGSTVVPAPIVSAVPTTVVQVPSVANTLADTLSLLTVSSLLAETLPLGPAVVAPVASWNAPYGDCGCGGYLGGYGYGPGYSILY